MTTQAPSSNAFVHLQVHSEFSLADGIIKVKELAKACAAQGAPAVALTDRGNFFGLVKFFQACLSVGVKPLVGVELRFVTPQGPVAKVNVLAMNQQGYRNLLQLVSGVYVDAQQHGFVERHKLFEYNEGLIVLSGAAGGDVGLALAAGDRSLAAQLAGDWAACFADRYYLEVQRTGRRDDERLLRQTVQLASHTELPIVATNEVCFLSEDDFEAHETRVCIAEGRVLNDARRERRYAAEQYLKDSTQMVALFADLPEAVANTVEIAKRCNVALELGTYYLPNYPVPDEQTLETYLLEVAESGLAARLNELGEQAAGSREEYAERLRYELDVINTMGFPGYFLIVMEFIQWARDHDVPVGPGRGSGAGSLVAYVLGITDLDPLRYDLLFERFLNPERVSMPDFDVDFCMEGRDSVIAHVSERYGANAVSQIITFGTMAAKAVVRDVARVQGKPYGLADRLSKLIPFEVGMTLHKAVEETAELREFIDGNEEVIEIMDMAYKLEGIVRNVGRHAGGVVIAPSALTDFVPLYTEESGGSLVSQFDKDDVEQAGLVKFDFLGLKTLTIIDWCVKSINAKRAAEEEPLDLNQLDLGDKATFDLLKGAQTTGVFQLESRGMKDLIRRLLPDSIEDIIALVALFRPGPLQSGAVDDYINRKHGREPVTYAHPLLEPVLAPTYGVVLYQEQVMQIAQVLAGFSLGQADLLRRAMGKKKPEEMAKVRKQFMAGVEVNNIDLKLAGEIFDLMEKFAGYAFNKSHSATYALVSYQTAWLKTHYPAEFMAATLSADMQNIDKVVTLVDEVRRMGLNLSPPSVNRSEYRFTAAEGEVIYGLGAVRGVGIAPVQVLRASREEQGAFSSLHEFCQRVDPKKANKRVLEALLRSGAMDALSEEAPLDQARAALVAELPRAVQSAEQQSRDQSAGMTDLFGGVAQTTTLPAAVAVPPLTLEERLAGEKDTLGLYLTGHPIDGYANELARICPRRLGELRAERKQQLVAGLVVSTRTMKSRRGGVMAFLGIDDKSARIEATLFSDVYEKYRHKLGKDLILVFEGEVQTDDFNGGDALQVRVESVYTIAEARARFARDLEIDLRHADQPQVTERLQQLLTPHRQREQGCSIALVYQNHSGHARIRLGAQWRVAPNDELLKELRGEFGDDAVQVCYASGR